MEFEWDEEKNRANQAKHGVAFEDTLPVFDDLLVMFRKDRIDEDGEQRWHAIGTVGKAVLFVVHVYRMEDENGQETIRIISAREANKGERRIYTRQALE